jgi:hypothetical protein
MPYVSQTIRRELYHEGRVPSTPGELNYVITTYLKEYYERQGLNYQTINDIVGALEGAKLEFYRRIAAPYEDTKIKENGDVY